VGIELGWQLRAAAFSSGGFSIRDLRDGEEEAAEAEAQFELRWPLIEKLLAQGALLSKFFLSPSTHPPLPREGVGSERGRGERCFRFLLRLLCFPCQEK